MRARLDTALFGGWRPLTKLRAPPLRFDTQDLAVSGGVRAQLKNAIRELRDGNHYSTTPTKMLDYEITETGKKVIVGVVDFGCDFAHPSFCDADRKRTRILALWDQNDRAEGKPGKPIVQPDRPSVAIGSERCNFGFGRVFTKQMIDMVLTKWREAHDGDRLWPYRAMGYDPHDNHYLSERPIAAHGTGVLDIAAGNRRPSPTDPSDNPTVVGMAPDAEIVFVQVRTHTKEDGRQVLDANDVVDGVAFIFHMADELKLPCVVNLSLNTMSGPHDGDGHFERRLANLMCSGSASRDIKGRAVVVAAGNLPEVNAQWRQWPHISDAVSHEQPFEFYWNLAYAVNDKTRNSLEIWYDATDGWLQVTLTHPATGVVATVNPGRAAEIFCEGEVVGSIVGSRIRPAIRDNADVKGKSAPPLPKSDHEPGRHVILLSLIPIGAVPCIGRSV